jgi:hypothetical protein
LSIGFIPAGTVQPKSAFDQPALPVSCIKAALIARLRRPGMLIANRAAIQWPAL